MPDRANGVSDVSGHAAHSQDPNKTGAAVCGCGHVHACPPDRSALVSARGLSLSRGGRDLLIGVDLECVPDLILDPEIGEKVAFA